MIKKWNTTRSKQNYSPYNHINTSQFIENEEEQLQMEAKAEELVSDELSFNIVKIKQCKQQTQQFLQDLSQQLGQQNNAMAGLKQAHNREKEKAKLYRLKYQQMMISNLRKQEELDGMLRKHDNLVQNYNFVKKQLDQNLKIWLEQQQKYKEKIRLLQKIVEEQENTKPSFKISFNQGKHQVFKESFLDQKSKSNGQSTFL